MLKLAARPQDDLHWVVQGDVQCFEFDLGLNDPYFPIEDEFYFNACANALTHFTKEIWPQFPKAKAILYRGSADFSAHFLWSEGQSAHFEAWKSEMGKCDEMHLKRLFCAAVFVNYFQMLASKLPDELLIELVLDTKNCGTLAETLHLLSPDRFDHFSLNTPVHFESNIGVCFPIDGQISQKNLGAIDEQLRALPSFRAVYETHLSEQWDGLDAIYVIEETLTERGKRILKGFQAAGGEVRFFGAEGFEPPTYWSQTSRASQTALCPEE